VDLGVQYQTHGVPISDYFPAGTESIVQKNSNGSINAVTPSNLSQSPHRLVGNEPLVGDWAGVFRLETFFNPQSGNISDALKSQVLNNGRALDAQSTNVDSSVADSTLPGRLCGLQLPDLRHLHLRRHVTLLADGIAKYDPWGRRRRSRSSASPAPPQAGGHGGSATDQSVKYSAKYGAVHLGRLYQFSGASGSTNTGTQLQLGIEGSGASVDAYYFKKYDAIATAPLSAAQVATLPTLGYSSSNSLAAHLGQ